MSQIILSEDTVKMLTDRFAELDMLSERRELYTLSFFDGVDPDRRQKLFDLQEQISRLRGEILLIIKNLLFKREDSDNENKK